MKKKKLKKYIKKRLHNIEYMARQGMAENEIAAEMDLTEEEFGKGINSMPSELRRYNIARNQGYSRDMDLLKTMMNDKDVNSTLAKLYFAQRYGITDRPKDNTADESRKIAQLFQELAEKLPK
jgi:hypothetical protein